MANKNLDKVTQVVPASCIADFLRAWERNEVAHFCTELTTRLSRVMIRTKPLEDHEASWFTILDSDETDGR